MVFPPRRAAIERHEACRGEPLNPVESFPRQCRGAMSRVKESNGGTRPRCSRRLCRRDQQEVKCFAETTNGRNRLTPSWPYLLTMDSPREAGGRKGQCEVGVWFIIYSSFHIIQRGVLPFELQRDPSTVSSVSNAEEERSKANCLWLQWIN